MPTDETTAQELYCPLLLQQSGQTSKASLEESAHFCQVAKDAGKSVECHTYDEASPGFWYPNSPNYRPGDKDTALQKSLDFMSSLIKKT